MVLALVLGACLGCSHGDDREADRAAAAPGELSRAALAAPAPGAPTPPPPGVVSLHAAGARQPFRAVGRLSLSGQPPFAQPILILDDGAVYLLAGPQRAACIKRQGQRLDVSGTVIGESSAPGVRGVVHVTRLREVRP
jgi:hypothetical protein